MLGTPWRGGGLPQKSGAHGVPGRLEAGRSVRLSAELPRMGVAQGRRRRPGGSAVRRICVRVRRREAGDGVPAAGGIQERGRSAGEDGATWETGDLIRPPAAATFPIWECYGRRGVERLGSARYGVHRLGTAGQVWRERLRFGKAGQGLVSYGRPGNAG